MNQPTWTGAASRLLEAVPDAILLVDRSGRIVLVNAETERLFGYPPEALLGQPVELLVPERLRPAHVAHRTGYAARPAVRPMGAGLDLYGRRKDGTEFPVEISLGPVETDAGILTMAAIRDITERRRVEAEQARVRRVRAEAEARAELVERLHAVTAAALGLVPPDDLLPELLARVQAILDVDTVVILLSGPDGAVLEARAARGLEEEVVRGVRIPVGRGFAGRVAAERRPIVIDDVEHADLLNPVLREKGVRSLLGVPLLAEGRAIGVLHVGSLTPRRFTEEETRLLQLVADRVALAVEHVRLHEAEREARADTEAASRAKDEFLATLSHELRTPLQAILGWAQVLQAGSRDPATRRAVDAIMRNARAQTRLVSDLLDVSRITSGRLTLDLAPIALEPVVRAAIESARPAADTKGVSLPLHLDTGGGLVLGDATRLQQVVANLLSNAVKATPGGGQVSVELRHDADRVTLRVRDSGKGIPPAFLPRIFERFSQLDPSVTRTEGGLGIGLAIVKHLVERHGGTVRAESPGEGQGATFTVTLPLSHRPGTSVQRPTESRERPCLPRLDGVRVLVVDDEPDTREVLQTMLEGCGAEVRAAGSVQEAIAALDPPPHVVISDIAMPDGDGYTLLRELRRRHDIPAAALTAYASQEDRRRALQAGFREHLAKPVQAAELAAAVARLAGLTPRTEIP